MNDSHASVPPPEVVQAFTKAALTALQELTQIEALAGPTPQSTVMSEGFLAATLRLMREVPGTMTLVLSVEAAARLAALYLPSGTTLTEEMIDDVVGEFANVIAGQSKTMLKGTPYHFTLSMPVVARVANVTRLPEDASRTLIAALDFESEKLLLILDLRPCPGA
jgi:CheY-specific phosphatase CheX